MWSKFDDQFYMNPKIAMLSRDEQDLYIAAIIYCNGQLTDGFIPAGVLPMLAAWSKIEANAQAIACRLLDAGLWETSTNGYNIHDFLDWNMSKAEVIAMKEARAEAGRRGGLKSVAKRQANASASAQAKSKQNSTQSQSQSQSQSPAQQTRKGKGKRESDENSAENRAALFDIVQALAEVCGMDFEANKGRLFREGKPLVGKLTPEEVRKYYGPRSTWYTTDWRGKMGEYPTPAAIRETFERARNGNGKAPVNQGYREQY